LYRKLRETEVELGIVEKPREGKRFRSREREDNWSCYLRRPKIREGAEPKAGKTGTDSGLD
jgi:hypothetical protein